MHTSYKELENFYASAVGLPVFCGCWAGAFFLSLPPLSSFVTYFFQ